MYELTKIFDKLPHEIQLEENIKKYNYLRQFIINLF